MAVAVKDDICLFIRELGQITLTIRQDTAALETAYGELDPKWKSNPEAQALRTRADQGREKTLASLEQLIVLENGRLVEMDKKIEAMRGRSRSVDISAAQRPRSWQQEQILERSDWVSRANSQPWKNS